MPAEADGAQIVHFEAAEVWRIGKREGRPVRQVEAGSAGCGQTIDKLHSVADRHLLTGDGVDQAFEQGQGTGWLQSPVGPDQ